MNKVKLSNIAAISIVIILSLLLPSCSNEKQSSLKLINVLSTDLYQDAHIAGSENVPYEDLEHKFETEWKNLPKTTKFVFYCSNYACTASGEGAKMAESYGFKDAYAYEGGMAQWNDLHRTDEKYKMVGNAQAGYLKRPNTPRPTEEGVKVVSAEQLRQMLQESHVKGW